jgi:hypothetical protein
LAQVAFELFECNDLFHALLLVFLFAMKLLRNMMLGVQLVVFAGQMAVGGAVEAEMSLSMASGEAVHLDAMIDMRNPKQSLLLLASQALLQKDQTLLMEKFASIVVTLARHGQTPGMKNFLSSMNETIVGWLQPNILSSLSQLQTTINSMYASIYGNCDGNFTFDNGPNGVVAAANQTFWTAVSQYRSCRSLQSSLLTAYNQSAALANMLTANATSICQSFSAMDQQPAISCGPSVGENYSSWVTRMANTYYYLNGNWTAARQACINATSNSVAQTASANTSFNTWLGQKATCDGYQDQMDAASCNTLAAAQTACSTYSACYSTATTNFRSFQSGWNNSQSMMISQWGTLMQMQCLMGALANSTSGTGPSNQVIIACTNATLYYQLAVPYIPLTYPVLPKPPSMTCTLPTNYAGTAAYIQAQYNVVPSNAPAKTCIAACCTTTPTQTIVAR